MGPNELLLPNVILERVWLPAGGGFRSLCRYCRTYIYILRRTVVCACTHTDMWTVSIILSVFRNVRHCMATTLHHTLQFVGTCVCPIYLVSNIISRREVYFTLHFAAYFSVLLNQPARSGEGGDTYICITSLMYFALVLLQSCTLGCSCCGGGFFLSMNSVWLV